MPKPYVNFGPHCPRLTLLPTGRRLRNWPREKSLRLKPLKVKPQPIATNQIIALLKFAESIAPFDVVVIRRKACRAIMS
jgi:hypothetical protein